MSAQLIRGVMTALLTPFDANEKLDTASLRRLVHFNINQGINGLYVDDSTGEAFVQHLAEREHVLEVVAKRSKGKAYINCPRRRPVSTHESQQLTQAACRYSFDAISTVTPFYYPFTFEEYCKHYRAIIDAANGLPIVVYNIPSLSGVTLTLAQIATLVTLPGTVALKQTSGVCFRCSRSAGRTRI